MFRLSNTNIFKSLCVKLFLCTFFVLAIIDAKAALSLEKADIPDLSNNAILCMHQDQNGYMWFGTYDGLNLFNGKDTYIFRFDPDNKNSLSSNIIHKITDAGPGYLWISTFLGLNKFSIRDKKVTETYQQYAEARLVTADSNGYTLVIGQNDFISCYSPRTKSIQDVHARGINIDHIKMLFTDDEDQFWMVMYNGVMKNIQPDFSTIPVTLKFVEQTLHTKEITTIFQEDNFLYFIDQDKQLFQYDTRNKQKTFISDLTDLITKYGTVSRISNFHSEIYLAFGNGELVSLHGPRERRLNIGIFCALKDNNQNILWIGTDGQGVQKFYEKHNMFSSILSKNIPFPLWKPIRALYTDSLNTLWVGTKGDGIACIKNYDQVKDRAIPKEQVIHFTSEDGLSDNKVYCFQKSRYRDIIWIGTEGPELSYYSYKTNKVYTLVNKTSSHIKMVHSICELNDSILWVATAGEGLKEVYLDTKGKELSVRYIDSYVFEKNKRLCREFHSMKLIQDSVLYLGSRGGYGLIRFNINQKKCTFVPMGQSENSSTGDILCVHPSKDSTFYFGASSGMTRMKFLPDNSNTAQQFTRKNGLANDMIHGILEDGEGCIWLSTNKGLAKYNPHNNFFHNYEAADLKVLEFSDDAYWKCPITERLFFGGINGLVWIDPHVDIVEQYKPELDFFELKMGNETYSLLDYKGKHPGIVKIPPSVSSFTVSFVATDYINGESYEYSYLLENYNTTWTELQKDNKVTFTKLPYGNYVLRVKYKNDVFDSDMQDYILRIRVLPPWYMSNWFISVYSITILLLILYAGYLLRRNIIRKQQTIARKIQEEQKEKLYEAKLNFFANITHELCTPLTLINGVNNNIRQYAEKEKDEKLRKNAEVLSENVSGLNELIQEILDFRKIEESGMQQCHIKRISISELMSRQAASFAPIAEHNKIDFEYHVPSGLYWNTDPAFLKKIVVNLISNAFKYTEEKGSIRVLVAVDDSNQSLSLKVHNTGQGIEKTKLKNIFDRYQILDGIEENNYMRTTSRNGLGLFICHTLVKALEGEIEVKSEVGKYAEFIVTLPYIETDETEKAVTPEQTMEQQVSPTVTFAGKPGTSSRPTILVIDDNKDIVWLIASTLSADYEVREVSNAREGLEIINKETPSLIITDIMMPDMNGFELVKIVKENKFTRHIPIVIVSAKITENEQAEGLNLGADAYLTKPFSPVVLHSIVNRLVAVKKEMKEYYHSPESAYEYADGQLIHQEDKEFIDIVNTIIKENIERENLWPDIITEKLGMNTRSFYRKFKKISSLTPTDYIKDYRFIYAAQLLITTNLTIQEVIYKVGISSKAYFYREFAKKYNMTPSEYRQQK